MFLSDSYSKQNNISGNSIQEFHPFGTAAAAHPSIGSRAACDVRGGVGGRVDLEFGFACFRATEAREREPRFSCERALRAASGHTVFAAADSGGASGAATFSSTAHLSPFYTTRGFLGVGWGCWWGEGLLGSLITKTVEFVCFI